MIDMEVVIPDIQLQNQKEHVEGMVIRIWEWKAGIFHDIE